MKKIIIFVLALSFINQILILANTQVPAQNVTVNTSSFTKNLNSSDSNVQAALQTIDQLSTGGGGTPGGVSGQFQYNNGGNFAGGNMYQSSTSSNVGIGSINPGQALDVIGSIRATNFIGAGTGLTGTASALNIGGNATTVTTNANLTGVISSSGNTTSITSQTGTGTTFVTSVSPTITGHPTIEGITSTGATGTGNFVFSGSPTLTSPALGTPSSGVATNLTGTASGLTAGTVSTINGLIAQGTNITITGSGTSGSPYSISSSGSGGGSVSPGGSYHDIQFYDVQGTVTSFGGNSGLFYSGTASTAGNVGIGSISPGKSLDVVGTVRAIGLTISGQTPVSGYVLTATDSNGDTKWSPVSGSVSPGGSNTQVQYNSSSSFAGNSGFIYNGSNVGIGSTTPGEALDVVGTIRANNMMVNNQSICQQAGDNCNTSGLYGIEFDNSNAVTSTPPSQFTGNFTITVSFETGQNIQGLQDIVNAGQTSPSVNYWDVYIDDGIMSYIDFTNITRSQTFADLILTPNTFYTLILTKTGTTVTAKLNGTTSAYTYTSGGTNLTNSGNLYIGNFFLSGNNFTGVVNSVILAPNGIVSNQYNFNEGQGIVLYDTVGGINATLTQYDYWVPLGPSYTARYQSQRIARWGDSITHGDYSTDGNGYVKKLSDDLVNHVFYNVGTLTTTSTDNTYEKREVGVSGITTSGFISTYLTNALTTIPALSPDIATSVIIQLGTNDVNTNVTLSTAVANIQTIINDIVTENANADIYVCLIIPQQTSATYYANVPTYNSLLRAQLVSDQVTNSHIHIIDLYAAFISNPYWSTVYMANSLHPNNTGYDEMGHTIAQCILNHNSPYCDGNVPWTALGGNIYSNNIGNIGIGTIVPNGLLDIEGTVNSTIFNAQLSTKNVGIGTFIPGQKLDVQGTVRSSLGFVSGSNCFYYCNGGTDVGVLTRGSSCLCPGGSCVATNICSN